MINTLDWVSFRIGFVAGMLFLSIIFAIIIELPYMK